MSRRGIADIGLALFALLMFALLWVTPYAAVTDYRSGEKDFSKRWVLLKRVTMETPRWDFWQFPPLSFDYGFPLGYKQFYVYAQDPKYRARVIENALIAAGGVLALFGGLSGFLYFTRRSTQHGDARFGSLAEADDARLLAKSGLSLGKLGGQNLVSNDAAHVLVVGPTRSGKGVSFVVPNGLTWRGSMVVLDIKMENFAKFGQARFAAGDAVFVFAPGSAKSHRYNPLDFVRPGPEMATDCANIAGFLCGGGIVENEWTMAARKVVGALLGYVLTSADFENQRYIRSAVRMISTGFDIEKLLRKIVASESGGRVPQWVLDEFNQFIVIPERTRGSVMFNVANAFAPWSSQLISAVTETSDFNLRDLRRKRMSIFIGAPLADLESYRPLVRILFQQIHDVLMRDLPREDEPHQVLLLLDEFFALGKMTSLASKIAVSAGYGFRMAIILQNISQLDEIYGRPTRETMVSGTAIKLFVAINDNETAEYVSKSLGSYTATSTTKVAGAGFSQARVSLGEMAVPLRRPQELTRMHRDTSILLIANSRPFEVRKVFYYKSAGLKRMMNASKRTRLVVPALDGWIDKVLWTDAAAMAATPVAVVASTPAIVAATPQTEIVQQGIPMPAESNPVASPELIVPETPSPVRMDHQTVVAEIVVARPETIDDVIVAPEPPLESASIVVDVAAPRLIHGRKATPPTAQSAKAKAANDGFDLTADIAAIEAKLESGAAAAMDETLAIIDQALASQPESKAEPIRRARARLKGAAAQARAKRA